MSVAGRSYAHSHVAVSRSACVDDLVRRNGADAIYQTIVVALTTQLKAVGGEVILENERHEALRQLVKNISAVW